MRLSGPPRRPGPAFIVAAIPELCLGSSPSEKTKASDVYKAFFMATADPT
jgi:hypothetical protein